MTGRLQDRDQSIAQLALASAGSERNHVDENDLALMDLNALSESETRAVRRHLQRCQRCRSLAEATSQGVSVAEVRFAPKNRAAG